jgi:serine/threonine protein kinase
MPTPPPDPTRRPSSAKHPAAGRPVDGAPPPGSTDEHAAGVPSLSDLLKTGSSARRPPSAADLAHMLPPAANTDDAPTVISRPDQKFPPFPPPPYVVGEVPSLAGRRLGHFELIEAIGSGGMAAVLKARDLELGRTVALKILPPESAFDPENVTRFKQEARAAARLDHENVARVYFCGEDQGLHFIAFEFVEGITLRQTIDRRGVLPAGECVRYMAQIAAGLQHAADRGVVHRDIKPSNVIITPDGRAKIVDMGLARHLESGSVNGGLTQSGVTLGTFDYISPEQALDPRRADVRSDIYSLGCSFYHALTGRPPVPEGTAAKKLQAHQQLDPLDPRELNPAVPDELAAVLARMMAKDPARRYQTPTDLIAHLKGVAARLNLSFENVSDDSVVKAVQADVNVLPDPPRLRLGWAIAAAAVAVAVGVFAVATSGPGHRPAPPPWAADGNRKDDGVIVNPAGASQPVPKHDGPAAHPAEPVVRTADDLAVKLRDPKTALVRLAAGKVYDLTKLSEAAAGPVVVGGQDVELAGSAADPPTVRVYANYERGAPTRSGTLAFAGCQTVNVHGVRFEVVTPPDHAGGEYGCGVAAADVGRLEFADCLFFADDAFRTARLSAAVFVGQPGEQPVKLTRCLFGPGSVGVEVGPRTRLAADDSGFAPQHEAAVRVRAGDGDAAADEPAAVDLRRSSFVMAAGAAVVLAEDTTKVTAGGCVFAPYGSAAAAVPGSPAGTRRAAVVRVPDERTALVTFTGDAETNAYYRVDALATAARNYTFDEAAEEKEKVRVEDKHRAELRARPWDGDVAALLKEKNPYPAFRLKPGADADDRLFPAPAGVIGAQFHVPQLPPHLAHRVYAGLGWPLDRPKVAAADVRQKVWRPGADAEALGRGEYNDLVKLLRDAKSGDEIQIRTDGPDPIAVEPTDVKPAARPGAERGEFKLTFRPHPDQAAPVVLTAARAAVPKADATLFRVEDGEVTFEGVQFLVKPAQPKHLSVSAVTLAGGRGCVFKNCVFTLAEDDVEAAAAVHLAGDGREMMVDPANPRQPPRVGFDKCLVRGKGRAVWAADGRSAELDLTNTVTALYGPVVYAKAGGREAGAAARCKVHLTRVTALLGGPVVEVHAGANGGARAAGVLRVDVETDRCLFAGVPDTGRPLAEVDGLDGDDPADVRMVLTWTNKADRQPNWYANIGASDSTAEVAAFKLADEAGTRKTWGWNQWIGFAGEPGGSPLGSVTFARKPAGPRDLAAVKPADLAVEAVDFPNLSGAAAGDTGADVRKLPTPAGP